MAPALGAGDVGVEVKGCACVASGLLLYIEIQESSAAMALKPYRSVYKATTACTLRLTQNWHSTQRVVVGESWFASYDTATALLAHGLEFQGIIKTAHSKYPLAYLRRDSETWPDRRGWFQEVEIEALSQRM